MYQASQFYKIKYARILYSPRLNSNSSGSQKIFQTYYSLVFFISGAVKYDYHGYYKSAIHPYNVVKGTNIYWQSMCDNDLSCNGYSIDKSNDDCFLSSCNIYTVVPAWSTCYFASNSDLFSNVLCQSTNYSDSLYHYITVYYYAQDYHFDRVYHYETAVYLFNKDKH